MRQLGDIFVLSGPTLAGIGVAAVKKLRTFRLCDSRIGCPSKRCCFCRVLAGLWKCSRGATHRLAEQLTQSTCATTLAQKLLRGVTCTAKGALSCRCRATCAKRLAQNSLAQIILQTHAEQLAQSICAEQLTQSTCAEHLRRAICKEYLAG